MPRIRTRPQPLADEIREELIDQMVAELEQSGGGEDAPVIFEIPIKGTDTVHVIVIWDRWQGVPPDVRSSIIMDAYKKYDLNRDPSEQMSHRVTLTVGASASEAIELGLLPYQVTNVMADAAKSDPRFEVIRRKMKKAGAIQTARGLELRFPTMQLAKEASFRLGELSREIMPEVQMLWQIGQDVRRIDDDD